MSYFFKQQRGMTLLETLVYVSLLAGIFVLVVNTLLALGSAYQTVAASRSLQRSATTAFDRMTHEIKQAIALDLGDSTFGVDPSNLTLSADEALVQIGVVDDAIRITDGGMTTDLTTGDVTVTSFVLERIETGRGDGVKITMTLETGAGEALRRQTFNTSALVRGGY